MFVREAYSIELSRYAVHLKNLDTENRTMRFCFNISDEMIDAFVAKLEPTENKLFCVEEDGEWIGVGHVAIAPDTNKVELAFSVLQGYQGQGIGNALMKRCIAWCQTHNYLEGELVCLPNNKAIQHLCAKNGIKVQGHWDERTGKFELKHPSSVEFAIEAFTEQCDRVNWVMKRTLTPWTFD